MINYPTRSDVAVIQKFWTGTRARKTICYSLTALVMFIGQLTIEGVPQRSS